MKITLVLPSYVSFPVGGYRVVYEHADRLASYGHAVTIVFPRRILDDVPPATAMAALKERLWPLKVRYRHRPLIDWHRLHPKVKVRLVPRIDDRWIPDGDAVVATAWQTAAPVAALNSKKGRRFYFIQHHETWAGPEDAVDETWRLPLRKVVISRWLRDLGHRLDPGAPIDYVPNGIDFERFQVVRAPENRPLSVVSLYHSYRFKGVPDALKALSRFHERHPDVPITLFGAEPPGSDVPEFARFVLRPAQDVLVNEIYNGHAIYLGASLAEGWALPPAEAMACGCAFVGTDIGGFREYATDGETALLSPAGDPDALFRNLCRMADDSALRRRIQAAGTANIRAFTWERASRALEAVLAGPAAHAS